MTETLANVYSSDSTSQELSNEYQHDRFPDDFYKFLPPVHLAKVAPASERLSQRVPCQLLRISGKSIEQMLNSVSVIENI